MARTRRARHQRRVRHQHHHRRQQQHRRQVRIRNRRHHRTTTRSGFGNTGVRVGMGTGVQSNLKAIYFVFIVVVLSVVSVILFVTTFAVAAYIFAGVTVAMLVVTILICQRHPPCAPVNTADQVVVSTQIVGQTVDSNGNPITMPPDNMPPSTHVVVDMPPDCPTYQQHSFFPQTTSTPTNFATVYSPPYPTITPITIPQPGNDNAPPPSYADVVGPKQEGA